MLWHRSVVVLIRISSEMRINASEIVSASDIESNARVLKAACLFSALANHQNAVHRFFVV